jgi:hypothetical protein
MNKYLILSALATVAFTQETSLVTDAPVLADATCGSTGIDCSSYNANGIDWCCATIDCTGIPTITTCELNGYSDLTPGCSVTCNSVYVQYAAVAFFMALFNMLF